MIDKQTAQSDAEPEFDLAFGSGGSAAVLAGAGFYSALQLAGIKKFRRIGGASGGAIAASIVATGLPAPQVLRLALDVKFDEHVNYQHGIYKSISRGVGDLKGLVGGTPSSREEEHPDHREWPVTGLLGTSGLGAYIRQQADAVGVKHWPDAFWTVATTKDGRQVVFNKDGVFLVEKDDSLVQLSTETVPLDIAVRYTATIPGVLAALEYKGMLLYDGSLSRDGLCPVGVQIRHFGADPRKVIAMRLFEDALHPISGRVQWVLRSLWRVPPEYTWGPETAGVIEFRPPIEHIFSLNFGLSPDQKWLAILISFDSALSRLAFEGLLNGDALKQARALFAELGFWRDITPSSIGAPQKLAERAELVFTNFGLLSK